MRRHRSSAVPLALLFVALIAYASLYPFVGWRAPGTPVLEFLRLPWPPYWTGFDLAVNLIGYLPLGALVLVAWARSGWRLEAAFALAVLSGGVLSFSLETLQNFLPNRVPSNVDLALNTLGAALGAAVAALLLALGRRRWQSWRDRWLVPRSAGGVALLLLWPVGLLFPLPLPLAVGQVVSRTSAVLGGWLEDTVAGPFWLAGLPDTVLPVTLPAAEIAVPLLGLLSPCLIAYAVSTPGWRRALLATGAFAVALGTTALSTALNFSPQHALAWATPRAVAAMAAGWLAATLLSWLPRRASAVLGAMALLALVVLVNQLPADPYFSQSLRAWEQGRFIHFHGAAQWVGWLWPYAALAYLLSLAGRREM